MILKRTNLNFKIQEFLKFEFRFTLEFIFEKMIYNKMRFKINEIYVIKLLKMIKISDVEEIKRIFVKSK